MRSSLQYAAWVTTLAMMACTVWTQQARAEEQDEYYELMRVFVDTFEQIDRNYVKDVDRRELVEAAVRGMLVKLDPYSDYISPDDLARFNEAVEQEFGGVGIQVHFNREQRVLEVISPLAGSPAYDAGIRAGDRIVEIEGEPVKDFPEGGEIQAAVTKLKGEAGVSVTVGIQRANSETVEKVTITRELIQLDSVMGDAYGKDGEWDFLLDDEKKIGYIRLTHFTRRTTAEMREAMKTLKDQGMKALILDLRFNPGGLLQAAVDVSDMFIESGKIVSTEGRNSRDRVWSAKKFGTYSDFPMAVLINRYSASASEIVSACLQDHQRAIVIGERSWGKGSVQNVIELEGGESALKLTTAGYHRPSGKNIHRFPNAKESDEWGVKPDDGFELKLMPQELVAYQRYRQDRDVLSSNGPPESDFVDTQLEKATSYIEEQLAKDGAAADETATDKTGDTTQPAEKKSDEKKPDEKPAEEKKPESPAAEEAPAAEQEEGDDAAASDVIPLIRMKLPHAA